MDNTNETKDRISVNDKSVDGNEMETNDGINQEEEKSQLLAFIAECDERLKSKQMQREENNRINIKYPEESFFVKLDSSIKKNSAFVKKLRNMSEAQRESIFKDMNGLNLTKYISEVASAIVEAKLKMSEITMALKLCSSLHQRYADFATQLFDSWNKTLPLKKSNDTINLAKMRIDLRFFAELISSGIFTPKEALPVLGNLLMMLTVNDKETHNNLNIILTFCRHCGDDYAGFVPRKMKQLAIKYSLQIPQSDFLHADRQKGVKNLLKEYYKSLITHVVSEHKQLKNQEKQIRKSLQMKGEVSKEKKEKFETRQIDWQKLWLSTQQFADILDDDLPELPPDMPETIDDIEESNIINFDVTNRFKGQPEFESGALWEDEDTRSFYQHLPDLRALIPSILYKDCVKDDVKPDDETIDETKTEETDKDKPNDTTTGPSESEDNFEDEVIESIEILDDVAPVIEGDDPESDEETGKELGKPSNKVLLDTFLNTLVNCVNREMIDKAALNFCTNLNTKNNRKKLVRTLFLVPRTRLDLLPFYSRFVAQISPIMPHVATDLVAFLKQDFRYLFKKKDQINIESKVKNVRFIGEMVKFGIFPKNDALHCLKLLLSDFRHHHIEMTCNLLETCGRYLFRSPDSHIRAKFYLEQMMRKKALMPFDSRYITNIENAYYFANPPESQTITRIERNPMQEYIRKLLYHDLEKTNVDKVLRQIRKLSWDDPEISWYAIKCLIAVWNVKFYNVRCLANLLAGLNIFQDWVSPKVIDGVLEDIRLGMEMNLPKYNQRRVSIIRYLGELYNYHLIDSSVVFKTIYSIITYGVYDDPSSFSELDPPDNLMRIRLVCQLLETCGQYFSTGLTKKKLEYFLLFFQRYFWIKKSNLIYNDDNKFPISMEYFYRDVMLSLRPKFKFADSLESATKILEDQLIELKPKVQEFLPKVKENVEDEDAADNDNSGLNPILEVDEDQEIDSEAHELSHHESVSEEDEYEGHFDKTLEYRQKTTTDEGSESDISPLDGDFVTPKNKTPKVVECAEDDDFKKDFDKLMSESLISRSQDVVRTNTDIVIPANRNDSSKKTIAFSDINTSDTIHPKESPINFLIMTRTKGNKPVLKKVDVPLDSDLAKSLKIREEKERAEKMGMKRLILDMNERREMEDRDAELERGTVGSVSNTNRDRRRYQHPKGAPDADAIFGNKRR